MAIAVSYGDNSEFNALCYGQKNVGTLQYLERQVENISNTLTDAGRSFFANSQQLWNQYNGSEALRLARAAARKVGSLFQRDEIRVLYGIGEIQTAPLSMQRYIMAEPPTRIPQIIGIEWRMYQSNGFFRISSRTITLHP